MFRPFRLIMFALIGFGVYVGFFQVPDAKGAPGDFTPALVAQREVEAWKADRTKEEYGSFLAHAAYHRELNRYSWFRAAEAGLEMSRVMMPFIDMQNRYERLLPNLEGAALVEKGWKGGTFDASAVARNQLTWMVTAKNPQLSESADVAGLMAEEYGARYSMRPDLMYAATGSRAEAFRLMIQGGNEPDWANITKLLEESYTNLQKVLKAPR